MSQYPVTIPAANLIAPTSYVMFLTGTAQIETIEPITDSIHTIVLIFTDAAPGALLTTGNIKLAVTPIQNAALILTYNPNDNKYYPIAVGSGGSPTAPGGADTSIQFNNAGAFGGFGTWDGLGSLLTVPGDLSILEKLIFASASVELIATNKGFRINPLNADECDLFMRAISDGFLILEQIYEFTAASGDVSPVNGNALTPGQTVRIADFFVEYNDTTEQDSADASFVLFSDFTSGGAKFTWWTNSLGDFAIGGVSVSYAGVTPLATAFNLFIDGATGDVTSKGIIQALDGYKSSDGSSGVTAGPFTAITGITVKNGLVTALTGT